MASYFVGKSGKNNWRVLEQTYVDGKAVHKRVPIEAYKSLGINPEWTTEQVRERLKRLNKENTIRRKDHRAAVGAARRVEELTEIKSTFLPESLVLEFTKRLEDLDLGAEDYKLKQLSRWKFVREMIAALKLSPSDYFDNKERIYKYFIARGKSMDHTTKCLRILNDWGHFICKKEGRFFERVPNPRGHAQEKINDSYQEKSEGKRAESDPLTPEMLEAARPKLSPPNYRWLFISVWFGPRPIEIDRLKSVSNWKTYYDPELKLDVLAIYQSKLTSIAKEKRWKYIPIATEEQKQALKMIEEGDFARPLRKVLKKVFKTARITTYAGRKGFVDLMLDRGQVLEDIAQWLGHQNIETTWSKYRNKRRVNFKKTG